MKDLGLPRGWKGIDVISGSCRAGNGYFDRVSTSASLSLSTDGLRLSTTAISPYDGPATGAISVSGRAISGSGLWANPDSLSCEYPRGQLPWTDFPGNASGAPSR